LPLSKQNKFPTLPDKLAIRNEITISINEYKHLKHEKKGCANQDLTDKPIIIN
jgi:hypothetical protein